MPVNNGIEYEILGESPELGIVIHSVGDNHNVDLFLSAIYDRDTFCDNLIDFSFQGDFSSNALSEKELVVNLFDVYKVLL